MDSIAGRIVVSPALIFLQLDLDAGAFCQDADRGDEVYILMLLNKLEHVAACVASETMEDLALRVDSKGRRFFLVEGTMRLEILARPAECQVRSDDVGDLVAESNFFENSFGNDSWHFRLPIPSPHQGQGATGRLYRPVYEVSASRPPRQYRQLNPPRISDSHMGSASD